jgi:hypothetical protein
MTRPATTLWDLVHEAERAQSAVLQPTMAIRQRYGDLVVEMKRTYGVRVRKWRKSTSGVAWTIRYLDGRTVKLVESPYPRGPMSCAVFLHEIGHHAIGLGAYRPRCLEEYHVWRWALHMMQERGFEVTQAVRDRMERSMRYAVAKARRRGMQHVPPELVQYL